MREEKPFGVMRAPGTVSAALKMSNSAESQAMNRACTG